jgi:hypothetical protein
MALHPARSVISLGDALTVQDVVLLQEVLARVHPPMNREQVAAFPLLGLS